MSASPAADNDVSRRSEQSGWRRRRFGWQPIHQIRHRRWRPDCSVLGARL